MYNIIQIFNIQKQNKTKQTKPKTKTKIKIKTINAKPVTFIESFNNVVAYKNVLQRANYFRVYANSIVQYKCARIYNVMQIKTNKMAIKIVFSVLFCLSLHKCTSFHILFNFFAVYSLIILAPVYILSHFINFLDLFFPHNIFARYKFLFNTY